MMSSSMCHYAPLNVRIRNLMIFTDFLLKVQIQVLCVPRPSRLVKGRLRQTSLIASHIDGSVFIFVNR